jgi:hypothetical protein
MGAAGFVGTTARLGGEEHPNSTAALIRANARAADLRAFAVKRFK